ncbi:uncharacterized protein [Amphiura filiformis]|uniref:uncharacterized protein n=1 Tax=Amphiura filiformis TaxID=82378 RepID=UPI003B223CF4
MDAEVEDMHVCLKCNSCIMGLENYVLHRKTQCPSLAGTPTKASTSKEGGVQVKTTPSPVRSSSSATAKITPPAVSPQESVDVKAALDQTNRDFEQKYQPLQQSHSDEQLGAKQVGGDFTCPGCKKGFEVELAFLAHIRVCVCIEWPNVAADDDDTPVGDHVEQTQKRTKNQKYGEDLDFRNLQPDGKFHCILCNFETESEHLISNHVKKKEHAEAVHNHVEEKLGKQFNFFEKNEDNLLTCEPCCWNAMHRSEMESHICNRLHHECIINLIMPNYSVFGGKGTVAHPEQQPKGILDLHNISDYRIMSMKEQEEYIVKYSRKPYRGHDGLSKNKVVPVEKQEKRVLNKAAKDVRMKMRYQRIKLCLLKTGEKSVEHSSQGCQGDDNVTENKVVPVEKQEKKSVEHSSRGYRDNDVDRMLKECRIKGCDDMYTCKICSYRTDREYDMKTHLDRKRHNKNVALLKKQVANSGTIDLTAVAKSRQYNVESMKRKQGEQSVDNSSNANSQEENVDTEQVGEDDCATSVLIESVGDINESMLDDQHDVQLEQESSTERDAIKEDVEVLGSRRSLRKRKANVKYTIDMDLSSEESVGIIEEPVKKTEKLPKMKKIKISSSKNLEVSPAKKRGRPRKQLDMDLSREESVEETVKKTEKLPKMKKVKASTSKSLMTSPAKKVGRPRKERLVTSTKNQSKFFSSIEYSYAKFVTLNLVVQPG